jgi:hypothetical protein
MWFGAATIIRASGAALTNTYTQKDLRLMSLCMDLVARAAADGDPLSCHTEQEQDPAPAVAQALKWASEAIASDGIELADRMAFVPASFGLVTTAFIGLLTSLSLSLRLISLS